MSKSAREYRIMGSEYMWKEHEKFKKKYIPQKYIYVKGHFRTSKKGKKFYVKPYNRTNPKWKKYHGG